MRDCLVEEVTVCVEDNVTLSRNNNVLLHIAIKSLPVKSDTSL